MASALLDGAVKTSSTNITKTYRDKRGRISLADLHALVELCQQRVRCYQLYEFQMQMQGYCSLQMWHFIVASGEEALTAWYVQV